LQDENVYPIVLRYFLFFKWKITFERFTLEQVTFVHIVEFYPLNNLHREKTMHRKQPQRTNKSSQYGATLVEYALFAALLAVVVIVSIEPLKNLI
jgi:hypothetical protein